MIIAKRFAHGAKWAKTGVEDDEQKSENDGYIQNNNESDIPE